MLTPTMLAPALEYDAEVSLEDLTAVFFEWLNRCGPFGIGNREPVFVTRGVTLASDVRLIKEKHVCLQLQNGDGTVRLSALGWSRNSNWARRCEELALHRGSIVDIAYRLKAGDNPQFPGLELELIDLKPN